MKFLTLIGFTLFFFSSGYSQNTEIEKAVFGTTKFYNIPNHLFTKVPDTDNHAGKGLMTDTNQNSSNFIQTICIEIEHCHGCQGQCDRCPICVEVRCWTGGEPGGGGGGSTGGGGGGSGPGGGGGGGGTTGGGGVGCPWYGCGNPPPNNPPLDRCQKVLEACQAATDLFRRTEMQSRKAEMTASFFPDREKAFWFGKINPNDPNYTTTNIVTGNVGISIPVTVFPPGSVGIQDLNTYGAAHAHTTEGFHVPSPGDMYNYASLNSQSPNFQYFIFSPGANDYAFVVSDSIFLRNFAFNWPYANYFDNTSGEFKMGTEIFDKYDDVFRYFNSNGKTEDEALELAQAFIAYQYQTGMTIAKMDAQGNFRPIFVQEVPDPQDPSKNIYQQTTVCNLNTIIIN